MKAWLVLTSTMVAAAATKIPGMLSAHDIPQGDWMTLPDTDGVEMLLQAHDEDTMDAETAEHVAKARRRFLAGYVEEWIEYRMNY